MYKIFSSVFTMLSSKYPKMMAGLERKCDEKVMNITLKQIYFLSFGGFMSIKQKHFREFLTTFIYRIMKSIIENVPNKSTSWTTVQFSIKAMQKNPTTQVRLQSANDGGHTLQINFSRPAGTYNNYFPHYRFRCSYKVHELYLCCRRK